LNLLVPDRTSSPANGSATKSLRVVSTPVTSLRSQHASPWIILFGIIGAFVGGFGLSAYWRPPVLPPEPKIQIGDFRVELPEGQTDVVVTSREGSGEELVRLEVKRDGNIISGVPAETRRIAPREALSSEDAVFFRRELNGVVNASDLPWTKANKIRTWLMRQSHKIGMPGLATRVPREAYQQMRQGHPVLCGNLAEIYAALCNSVGLTARPVGLSVAIQNGSFGLDTHAGTEVWIEDFGGWIYQDPLFNCYWTINGKPASALALHDAVMSGQTIAYAPRTSQVEEGLRNSYIDPRLYFRHISYEYKAGGTVLYYADKRLEPLSLKDKNWIHTSDRLDIERLDAGGKQIVEHRAQIAPGIWVQLLDGDLFVRDRRERSQGIRVRSSTGAVEGCAYLHQRAEDLGLFSATNLARNPSFRLTSRSNQIADDWSVAGPVEAMTVSGGQAMAALAGGRLWQRIQAKPHTRYLLYARVTVSRGLVNWKLADAERGVMSMGTIEPERISEVVSDLVESESGYIDVQFDVPSGGAFRVMDVIVAEAPRFSDSNARFTSDARKQIALR
jgi:Transglutaminase-like superfamily